jgi:hypothetical protein
MKTKRRFHHDDDFRLGDGERLRVPLTMMDSVQRSIAMDGDTSAVDNLLKRVQQRDAGPMRVVDGVSRGRDGTAMHRPGYRLFDGDDAWEHQKARMYDEYNRDLRDAYKGPGVRNDINPIRDSVATARAEYKNRLVHSWRDSAEAKNGDNHD